MFKVKISTPDYKWPLIRQTPGQKGIWGDYEFIINEDIEECDYWVVYEGLEHKENVYCYPENIFLITGEPPSVKKYNKNFLQQFFGVITSHTEIEHSRRFYTQQALPWMVGGRYLAKEKTWDEHFSKDYDELSNINGSIQKIKLMSMVCSNKDFTSGHSQRMQFVKKLSKHFGSDIDIFGVGIKNIEDKWDAIATYKYHIVVENCAINNYFSEKLSDSFLASTYPLYYGCPNITEYFPADSLSTININDLDAAIVSIENIINSNLSESNKKAVAIAKDKALNEYNLFPMLVKFFSKQEFKGNAEKKTISLYPELTFKDIPKVPYIEKLYRWMRGK